MCHLVTHSRHGNLEAFVHVCSSGSLVCYPRNVPKALTFEALLAAAKTAQTLRSGGMPQPVVFDTEVTEGCASVGDTGQTATPTPYANQKQEGDQIGLSRLSDRRSVGRIEADVHAFAEALTKKYGPRIRRNPKMFKSRVFSLLRFHLPPYPRQRGRPTSGRITMAVAMFLNQQKETAEGKRKHVDWRSIASECVLSWSHLRSYEARRVSLDRLRNSVNARLRRSTRRSAKISSKVLDQLLPPNVEP